MLQQLFRVQLNADCCNEPADYAYFPVSGMCSVIAVTAEKVKAETGIIGREGFVGSLIVLYAGSSPFDVIVQVEGRALRISRVQLQKAMSSHHGYSDFAAEIYSRLWSSTRPNGSGEWPFYHSGTVGPLAGDVLRQGRGLPFVEDPPVFIVMLAVRRAGVTDEINELEGQKLIKSTRG